MDAGGKTGMSLGRGGRFEEEPKMYFAHIVSKGKWPYYKSFTIVIYDRNDSGLYYKSF
jgi:hypothetical protein